VSNAGAFGDSGPRDVLVSLVKPVGYASNAAWFRLYSFHLKAGGPATADSTTRRAECAGIRNTLNTQPTGAVGTNFVIGGDSNFYSALEGGYIRLTESQSNNNGRSKDYLTMPGNWHVEFGYAAYDTHCPCLSCS